MEFETRTIGRQREADTQTWVGTNSDERYDQWKNEDQYITFRQTLGARLFMNRFTTASIRLIIDQPIWENQSVKAIDARSDALDTTSPGRDRFGKHFMLHAGFQLP